MQIGFLIYKLIMKYLHRYNDLNEGKLFIEDESTFDQDVKWDMEINISKIWKDFGSGVLDLNSYNKELAIKLEENLGEKLPKFVDIIKDLNKTNNNEESITIWNKLYDIADKNLVELKP